MGFKIEPTEAVIEFDEGHPLHGAEVRVSLDLTLAEHTEMLQKTREGDQAAILEAFARCLRSWNVEWDGAAVQASREGLDSLPSWVVDAMATAWLRARGGLPLATGSRSTPGGQQA